MGKQGWIIFSVLTAAVLGGLVYFSMANRLDVSTIDTNSILSAREESGNIADHVKGNAESSNILVEYGDFQCPGCAGAFPHVKTLVDEYGEKIAFVFRNFPLTTIHPNAKAAASAAEAAGLQGKFWEMHDLLFANQNDWSNATASERQNIFMNYANQLDLDAEKFESDYTSEAVKRKISFDQALGGKDGVTGTPHFILNGTALPEDVQTALGNGQLDTVREWIDGQIKE